MRSFITLEYIRCYEMIDFVFLKFLKKCGKRDKKAESGIYFKLT